MNLLILDQLAEDFKETIKSKFPQLAIYTATSAEEVGNMIESAEILLVMGPPAIKLSNEMIKRASKLQWIQSIISGVDFLISLPSLSKDILITSTRGIHGPQVSELAFLFMLSLNRNFPQIIRNQDNKILERWVPNSPNCLIGARLLFKKKVGILGLGVIGEQIARKCKAFDMTVYGVARTRRLAHVVDYFFLLENLLDMIKEVDYFINILPSTPETQKVIGAKEFSSMKSTAFFINVGRGDAVDEEALIQALSAGKIAGAGLDVFYREPLPRNSQLWDMKNVIITPHIGGQSEIYVEQDLSIFEENLRRFLKGERQNLINVVER